MTYERLSMLADLLNQHHGEPDRHGFVVAPENEVLLTEHKNAITHAGRLFNYQLVGTERLGILSVTREVTPDDDQAEKVSYTHTRLEHLDHEALTHPAISGLLEEYREYKKSQIMEY